ncbi:hypothetical protein Y032_0307g2038 [Ancylostoma ceylanicum]|nr:hypothetical protein Y032_0307g2038 [Ancylostoma ceylanicum]
MHPILEVGKKHVIIYGYADILNYGKVMASAKLALLKDSCFGKLFRNLVMYHRHSGIHPLFILYAASAFEIVKLLSLMEYCDSNTRKMCHFQEKASRTIMPYNFTMLPNLERCRGSGKKLPVIVTTVLSVAKEYGTRQSIRRSWASRRHSRSIKNGLVVVFFILSATNSDNELLAVQREQKLYGDIIMSDLVESYDNLVHKVHACMSFFTNYCREASFLMKADDDVAIHFDRLLDSFQVNSDSEEKLFCSILNNTEPIRVLNDKWYVSESRWPLKFYPNYCNGPFYIIGREAVKRISKQSLRFPVFTMEDIFYTGILAGSLEIGLVNWKARVLNHLEYPTIEVPLCDRYSSPQTIVYYPLSSPREMEEGFLKLKSDKCH